MPVGREWVWEGMLVFGGMLERWGGLEVYMVAGGVGGWSQFIRWVEQHTVLQQSLEKLVHGVEGTHNCWW